MGSGLPNVQPNGIEIIYPANKIRVDLWGRGVWEHDLFCPSDYDLTLSGNIASGFYEAENNINITASTGNTTNSGDLIVRAGNEIIITATGTNEVILGHNTHLFIHACDHAGNSFKKSSPPQSPQRGEENSGTQESGRELEKPDDERQIVEGQKLKFAYYSNPFRDHLHVDVLLAEPAHLKIEALNIRGHLVDVLANQYANAGELGFLLNASPLPAGVYFIKVTAGDERLVRTVLKEK